MSAANNPVADGRSASESQKDRRLRDLPTRRARAHQWFVEATERGDRLDLEDFAGMLEMFADFEEAALRARVEELRELLQLAVGLLGNARVDSASVPLAAARDAWLRKRDTLYSSAGTALATPDCPRNCTRETPGHRPMAAVEGEKIALEQRLREAFQAGAARAIGSHRDMQQIHPSEDEWVAAALNAEDGGEARA